MCVQDTELGLCKTRWGPSRVGPIGLTACLPSCLAVLGPRAAHAHTHTHTAEQPHSANAIALQTTKTHPHILRALTSPTRYLYASSAVRVRIERPATTAAARL